VDDKEEGSGAVPSRSNTRIGCSSTEGGKDLAYYHHSRGPLYDFVRAAGIRVGPRVLNVGCAAGLDGPHIRALGGQVLTGIEPTDAANSASLTYDSVLRCSFEEFAAPPFSFDNIIFADSFEHLSDPWQVLEKAGQLLTDGGSLIMSVPNVRHVSVLFDLLVRGDFEYAPEGIRDSTHLRFFTRKSLLRLLASQDLVPIAFARYGSLRLGRLLERLIPGSGEFLLTSMYLVARKGNSSEVQGEPAGM
jgi:SAM-dependent methyltransferase